MRGGTCAWDAAWRSPFIPTMEINKMIAIAQPTDEEIRRKFKELLPELSSRLRHRFCQHEPDLRDEHIAEGIAISWQTYQSARRRGREPTAGNLAWYSGHCVLSGRRLMGVLSVFMTCTLLDAVLACLFAWGAITVCREL